ncbi:amidophosphoribosyltransferase, partial [bacterium]
MKRIFLIFIISFFSLTCNVSAKSMFAIGNMYGAPSTVIISYDLQPEGIQKQEILNIPSHGTGAYDICVEPENELLFISFKNSNIIEMVNASMLTSWGGAQLGEISNPASIKY